MPSARHYATVSIDGTSVDVRYTNTEDGLEVEHVGIEDLAKNQDFLAPWVWPAIEQAILASVKSSD
jgi:hypothetical protein